MVQERNDQFSLISWFTLKLLNVYHLGFSFKFSFVLCGWLQGQTADTRDREISGITCIMWTPHKKLIKALKRAYSQAFSKNSNLGILYTLFWIRKKTHPKWLYLPDCRVGKIVFTMDEPFLWLFGYPLQSGKPWSHLYKRNTKGKRRML